MCVRAAMQHPEAGSSRPLLSEAKNVPAVLLPLRCDVAQVRLATVVWWRTKGVIEAQEVASKEKPVQEEALEQLRTALWWFSASCHPELRDEMWDRSCESRRIVLRRKSASLSESTGPSFYAQQDFIDALVAFDMYCRSGHAQKNSSITLKVPRPIADLSPYWPPSPGEDALRNGVSLLLSVRFFQGIFGVASSFPSATLRSLLRWMPRHVCRHPTVIAAAKAMRLSAAHAEACAANEDVLQQWLREDGEALGAASIRHQSPERRISANAGELHIP
jgi:hypothetical protein